MLDLPFGPMDPHLLTELLRRQVQSPGRIPGPLAAAGLEPGYRPPSGGMPGMPEARSVPGFNIDAGVDAPGAGLAKWKPKPRDPGEQARRAAIAAGMLAGTNPDLGLVPGSVAANQPLDGGSGVGTSPYGQPDRLSELWRWLSTLRGA